MAENNFKQTVYKYLKGNFGALLQFVSFLMSAVSFGVYILYTYDLKVNYFFIMADWIILFYYLFEYII